jgi:UDP-2,3-diacylglucosamine pyrophosphatase LpxH
MTIAEKRAITGTWPSRWPGLIPDVWGTRAQARLTDVFETAQEITFNDASKIVFFSDCHRGDKSKADNFSGNEKLYLAALNHYYREGFSYVEVGDGDEMWKNGCFSDILHAHRRTFDLLHKFDRQDRLHIILGNHDIRSYQHKRVEKDGIIAKEGLVLRYTRTGQRIFVAHGHQADFKNDRLCATSRLVVRHFWRRLQLLGFETVLCHADTIGRRIRGPTSPDQFGDPLFNRKILSKIIERRIVGWVRARRQIIICGHTHRPMSAGYDAPPYFNAGSCVFPGVITGLEIQNGEITLVKWSCYPGARNGGMLRVKRERLAPPRKIYLLGG